MMKKIVKLALFLIICIGLMGCGNKTTISSQVKSITIYENETFELRKSYFDVENYEGDIIFAILDTDIASLDGMIIKPKSAGTTYVRASISDKIFCDVKLNILQGSVASNISIQNYSVTLNLVTQKVAYNKVIFNEEITEIPVIEYNSDIIDYDYNTGKITAKTIGHTTVKIKFIREEISFTVNVEDIVYANSVFINDINVKTGSTGVFNIIKDPSNCNAYALWVDNEDKDIIEVSSSGHYTAKSNGTARVFYNYKRSPTAVLQESFVVNVISELSETSLTVADKNYFTSSKCFFDKEYYFIVNLPEHYTASRIIASDNIKVTSVEYVEGRGFVGTFTFKNLGVQYVFVTYEQDIHNPENNITYKCSVEVVNGDNYSVCGKHSAYLFYPNNEGGFDVILVGAVHDIKYIMFFLDIDGILIEDGYSVYQITDERILLEDNTFNISSSGTFNFELEYEDKIISFSVNVYDNR